MTRLTFTIKSLIALTLAIACGLAVVIWLKRLSEPVMWRSSIADPASVTGGTVRYFPDDSASIVKELAVEDAREILDIAYQSPTFQIDGSGPAPSFPPAFMFVTLTSGNLKIQLDIHEGWTLLSTEDAKILECDEFQNELRDILQKYAAANVRPDEE